jgi:hypothetical protein
MNVSITLSPRQQTAFDKRVTGNATAETLAATIVTDQAEQWADSDRGADVFGVLAADFKNLSPADAKTIEDIAKKIRDGKPKATVKIAK